MQDDNLTTRSKYDKEGKIRRIVETTYQLIVTRGYDQVTTRLIAKMAGVSVGTVYLYFPAGKEGIIKAMVTFARTQVFPEALTSKQDFPDFDAFLREYLGQYLAFHRQHRPFLLALERAFLLRPDLFQDVDISVKSELSNTMPTWLKIIDHFKIPLQSTITPDHIQKLLQEAFLIIDALVHRHILFSPLFEEDTQLIAFCTRLLRDKIFSK